MRWRDRNDDHVGADQGDHQRMGRWDGRVEERVGLPDFERIDIEQLRHLPGV